jgi:GTPase Era involved in 16S rRNA processing
MSQLDTLVDLPGFHTDNDDGTKKVNQMVRETVEMPGTLALHIVKGDQDYASLLGNDFMRQLGENDNPRVTVLTHCDKLEPACVDDIQRLQKTLDITLTNSSHTFAVNGCAVDAAEEVKALQHLAQMDGRLTVGATHLCNHLEKRMREHLDTQFPKAVSKLRDALETTNAQIEEVKEQPPVDVVIKMAETMRKTSQTLKGTIADELRVLLTEMTMEIKNFVLEPLSVSVKEFLTSRDTFEEPLEIGMVVNVDKPKTSLLSKVTITGLSKAKTKISWVGNNQSKGDTAVADVYSGETAHIDTMVEDIELLIQNRGYRNAGHADRQPVIAAYAASFAKHYTKAITKTARLVATKLRGMYDSVFSSSISESARTAASHIRQQFETALTKIEAATAISIQNMGTYNSESDLIMSPNEHYLNDLLQKMVAADRGMATDSGGSRHIYHNVRAYIKVQRKQISELAWKESVRVMVIQAETAFSQLLTKQLSCCVQLVQEPPNQALQRETLAKRKIILEQALDIAAGGKGGLANERPS